MITMKPEHYLIVKNILSKYQLKIKVFGSRVNGNNRPYSDLDLCIMQEIDLPMLGQLREELESSNLPYELDLVCWWLISDEFKQKIQHELVEF